MNKAEQAKVIRDHLKASDPTARGRALRKAGKALDLKDIPGAEIAMACVDGLGPVGAQELIVAVGLWLVEHH